MTTIPLIDLGSGVNLAPATGSTVPLTESASSAAVPVYDAAALRLFSEVLSTPIRENVVLQEAFETATRAFAQSIAPVVRQDVTIGADGADERPANPVAVERQEIAVERSATPVVVEKPVATTVVEKPATPVLVEKPVTATVVEKPVAPVAVEKPATPIVMEKPTTVGVPIERLTTVEAPVENPANPVAVERQEIAVERRATPVVVEKPVATTVVEKPATPVLVEKPVTATVVEKPVAPVAVEKPATPIVMEKPTTVGVPIERPTTVGVPIERPTTVEAPVEKPANPVAVERPEIAVERPATPVVVEKPAKGEVAVASKDDTASDESDRISAAATQNAIDVALAPARRAVVQSASGSDVAASGVDAVSARTVEVAERVARVTTEMDVLVQAADAVVDTMLVSPGLMRGEGEVRVILKPDVLGGSELRLAVAGRTMEVEFIVPVADVAVLIERSRPQLEQRLVARIHAFDISVKVSGTTGRPSRRRNGDYS